jgi:Membrane-bound metallopeptidase
MSEIKRATTQKTHIINRAAPPPQAPVSFQWIPKKRRKITERLFANIVTATAVLLCVTVLRAANDHPRAQSVFRAVQDSVRLNLDEGLGKLSFVSNLLPETALVFWDSNTSTQILAPVEGDIIHVWNADEPYISMKSSINQVRCVMDGEVMSVSHGNDEELIVRVRHNNNFESIYGNLKTIFFQEGDAVYQEDLIGEMIGGKDVIFELRRDGRSVDPTYSMRSISEP